MQVACIQSFGDDRQASRAVLATTIRQEKAGMRKIFQTSRWDNSDQGLPQHQETTPARFEVLAPVSGCFGFIAVRGPLCLRERQWQRRSRVIRKSPAGFPIS